MGTARAEDPRGHGRRAAEVRRPPAEATESTARLQATAQLTLQALQSGGDAFRVTVENREEVVTARVREAKQEISSLEATYNGLLLQLKQCCEKAASWRQKEKAATEEQDLLSKARRNVFCFEPSWLVVI